MIVFCSFVCPWLDIELLPFWIKHYVNFHFDRYIVTLHRRGDDSQEMTEAYRLLQQADFEIREITGLYNNGRLQEICLATNRSELEPDDVMVIADSDEFHDMPFEYREIALEYDCIRGILVDRWDSTLHEIYPNIPLAVQYPHKGEIFKEISRKLDLIGGSWEFTLPRTKILCSKVRMPVSLNGSHCFSKTVLTESYAALDNKEVHHYSWRPSAIKRVAGKGYVPIWWLAAFVKYFNLSEENDDYKMVIERIEKRQEFMGWQQSGIAA